MRAFIDTNILIDFVANRDGFSDDADKLFALPMSAIATVISKPLDEIYVNEDQATIVYKDRNIPLHSLANILNLEKKENLSASSKYP